MKVEINKTDKTVGMKKTATIYIAIEADESLIKKIESAVKKIAAKGINNDKS